MREPRDPLLKVLNLFFVQTKALRHRRGAGSAQAVLLPRVYKVEGQRPFVNDPSAGSPTETLLRLLLPLDSLVRAISVKASSVARLPLNLQSPH